jgi:hypothetical protein
MTQFQMLGIGEDGQVPSIRKILVQTLENANQNEKSSNYMKKSCLTSQHQARNK